MDEFGLSLAASLHADTREDRELGIAGAVGDPAVILRGTKRMTLGMLSSDDQSVNEALLTGDFPGAAFGVVERQRAERVTSSSLPSIHQDQELTLVLTGTIVNAGKFCRVELGAIESASEHIGPAILAGYRRCGPDFVARLQGAFAIAIWDDQHRRLFLARDRLGIRPLYYYWRAGAPFLFASKVRALLASGLVPPKLSHPGVHSYLMYGVTCEPFTAIEDVFALPPAYWTILEEGEMTFQCYWDIFADLAVMSDSIEQAAVDLRPLLQSAVHRHMGYEDSCVFLSGGIDSSALAALANQETGGVNTVSLVVEDTPSEESYIDIVQKHLRSTHTSVGLSAEQAFDWFEDYIAAMDQPTVDGLNAYAVSRVASELGFRTALYGLGGDELFGPIRHHDSVRKMELVARLPTAMTTPAGWLLGRVRRGMPGRVTREWLGGAAVPGTAYDFLTRFYVDSEMTRLWRGAAAADAQLGRLQLEQPDLFPILYSRLTLYYFLKNQLLRIADWAGAANTLEIRVPFLDESIVHWALRLPPHHKAKSYKPVLAGAVADLLPDEILQRSKKGFSIPHRYWMQHAFRHELERTLRQPPDDVASLADATEMRSIWKDFLVSGDRWECSWGLFTLCRWWSDVNRATAVGAHL